MASVKVRITVEIPAELAEASEWLNRDDDPGSRAAYEESVRYKVQDMAADVFGVTDSGDVRAKVKVSYAA
jgi:hypothetical protein